MNDFPLEFRKAKWTTFPLRCCQIPYHLLARVFQNESKKKENNIYNRYKAKHKFHYSCEITLMWTLDKPIRQRLTFYYDYI